MISQDESKHLIDTAINYAGTRADGVEIAVYGSNFATSRFANNSMTQNQAPEKITLSIRVISGKKQLRLNSDDITEKGIQRLVDNAITAVKLLPEDSDFLGLPQENLTKQVEGHSDFNRYDAATGEISADARADSILSMIAVAKKKN